MNIYLYSFTEMPATAKMPVALDTPQAAQKAGMVTIDQELSLVEGTDHQRDCARITLSH